MAVLRLSLLRFSHWETILFAVIALVGGTIIGFVAILLPNPFLAFGIILIPVGVWLIFNKPELGLLFLFFMVFTRLSDVLVNTHSAPSIAKLFIPFMVVVILARWFLYQERPKDMGILGIVAVYGLLGLASVLYAADSERVTAALTAFVKDALIFLIIITLLRRAATLRLVIWTLLAAAIILGTIGVYQQITGTFTNNYWGFASAEKMNIVGRISNFRLGGPLLGPNAFGQYLLFVAPLALDRFWNEKKPLLRALAAWALTVSLLSIFFTFSRGTFLAMVLTFAFMFYRRRLSLKILLSTAVLALILVPFVPGQYTERLFSLGNIVGEGNESFEADASLRGRASEYLSGWMMFTDHPVLGVGLNNYEYHYQTYSRQLGLDPRREERAPHNLYLEYISELGIGGITWLIALQIITFWGLYQAEKTFRQLGMTDYANICIGLSAALVGFLVTGIFLHVAHPRFFWMLYGLMLAVPIVAKTELIAAQKVADA